MTAAILTVLFSGLSVYLLQYYEVFGILLAGALSAVCLSFVFRFFSSPISLLLPFAGVALMTDKLPQALICTGAIAVCGAFFALMLIRRWDYFSFFMGGSLMYTVIIGGAGVVFLTEKCGSLKAGLEKIMELVPAFIEQNFASYGEDVVAMLTTDPEMYVAMLPSVVATFGIVMMWLTNRFVGGFYAILGGADATGRPRTGAPKTLAWIFILLAIFGTILASGDKDAAYVVMNLKTVLTAVFFGEGVRAFIHKVLFMRGVFARVVLAVIAVNLFLFLSPVAIMVLSYYGVYKTLYRPTIIKIIRKDE